MAGSGRSIASPTPGARQLHPDLSAPDDAIRIRKGANGEDGYSAFTMRDPRTGDTTPTELEGALRRAGVTDVVVCGLATDYCVSATAQDAVRLGFATSLLIDAIAAVGLEPGDGARAIDAMRDAGIELRRAEPGPPESGPPESRPPESGPPEPMTT